MGVQREINSHRPNNDFREFDSYIFREFEICASAIHILQYMLADIYNANSIYFVSVIGEWAMKLIFPQKK